MNIMTKRGDLDNIITYQHICDTKADMSNIPSNQITLGTVCIVLQGESNGLQVYIANSQKQWFAITTGISGGANSGQSTLQLHICDINEYNNQTNMPTVTLPNSNTIYLVPTGNENDLYAEWIYVNNSWERFGNTAINLNNYALSSDIPSNISELTNDIGYLTQQDISSKADKTNTILNTTLSRGRLENTTIGEGSFAFGIDTTASGAYSHAEGANTTASYSYSHAEGADTVASGDCSHAEGQDTTASGIASHAEGTYTVASGDYSHAEGTNTIATGDIQHAGGKYNIQDLNNTYAEIIGIGTYDNARANGRTLDWNGNGWYAGKVTVGNTTPTENGDLTSKAYVDTAINNIELASSEDAEAWASGTRSGNAVLDTDPTYHNNAKYYASHAFSTTPEGYEDLVDNVDNLKSTIEDFYILTLYEADLSTTETKGSVTFEWDGSECHISGTSDGNERNSTFHDVTNALPKGMKAGGTYYVKYSSANVYLDIYPYSGTTLGTRIARTKSDTSITLPSGTTGLFMRFHSDYNKTIDQTVRPLILNSNGKTFTEKFSELTATDTALDEKIGLRIWPKSATPYVSEGTLALGNIREDGRYIIDTTWTISDAPPWSFPNSYVLTVENYYPTPGNNFCKQTVYGLKSSGNKKTFCRMRSGGEWNSWIDLSPMYDNVILPTGDITDRKTEIEAALTSRGGIILAPGDYYVSGITMPDDTSIKGGGMGKTRLFYIAGSTGSCITMGTRCNVSDLSLYGQNSDAYNENTDRNGLGWVGTYVSDENPGTYPVQGMISNLYIEGFKGGGIYCANTSMGSWSGLQAENVTVFKCWAGIYIKKYSEFAQFTNIRANNCTYGCINNGGNNVFANCNFSKNTTALLMDDTDGQAPNNSHGSFVGCVFDHSGGNDGYAMILTGLDNGEMFTGCQIFYGKTQITGCVGVRFVGCNYGRKTNLEITDSYAISYDSCQFRASTDTPLTQSGNTGLLFNNCLLYDGTGFNPVT